MRSFLAVAVLLLLANARPGIAQLPPNGDPGMVYVRTFTTTVSIPCGSHSSSEDVGFNTFVWRTVNNQIIYQIDIASITISGCCGSEIDNMTTTALFNLLGQVVVGRGIAMGYTSCPSTCTPPEITRVYTPSCVERIGSGEATEFEACDEILHCYRRYQVCCPNGISTPSIVQLPSPPSVCSGTGGSSIECESSCP